MKSPRYIIALIALAISALLFSNACSNNVKDAAPVEFPTVKVPAYINDNALAASYMVENHWNGFFKIENPSKEPSSAVHGVDSVSFENAFGMYAQLLAMTDRGKGEKSLRKLFGNLDTLALKGERKPLLRVMSLMEHYFYNPISPVLDEEIYLAALNCIMASASLSDLDKMQYDYQHRICSMNRVGTPAADFTFRELLASGKFRERNLYNIKGEYTLLFFNNPDCSSCVEILRTIKDSPLEELVGKGELQVLAMYIDEDLEAWKRNREKYSKGWIYAYDPQLVLRDNGIYGLRAIPSLYLLDKEKRVLLKDAPVEKVISYLMRR
ncbi:MAG: DUF5106 domain-containing protein [Bacteroidales bacterium]|nr:DUF5106 domain-containing protein [Bacteroidales bacterium]